VDELRAECLGASGNTDIRTPHIDQLATEGVRYDNSFCPFPVCTPSRYSLLSGRYVHDHHGWTNRSTLAPEIATFPKILRAAGYRTKAVGKMHFTPTYLDVGFSELCLAEQDGPGRWDDDYHRYLMKRGLVDRNDLEDQLVREYRRRAPKEYWDTCGALVSNLPEEHYSTTWIANRAVETLESWNAERNQLLMVGFIKPHHPFDPPSPWHRMYDPEEMTLLPGWTQQCIEYDLKHGRGYFPNDKLTEPVLERVMAYYYATISQIDHHVGRMVETLKQKKLYDKTLIVVTADHGDYMGFHHMLLKGNYMYDPVVKVPLILKWPGNQHRGVVSKRLVNNIDLAPTLCLAAGCRPAETMHGYALRDEDAGHKIIFAEAESGRQVMARSRSRKLILAAPRGKNLFFDLEKDPLEMNNLYDSSEYREEIGQMENALTGWRCKDSKPQVYRDEQAPTIRQPNVPSQDLSHRAATIRYYREKMLALQGRT
ncbi:MAG: sulfatase-like hydrolase/transferase, partial [Sedimentisphaerales bacterium]